jgi:hypothetical protein
MFVHRPLRYNLASMLAQKAHRALVSRRDGSSMGLHPRGILAGALLLSAPLITSVSFAAENFESHYTSVAIEKCRTVDEAKPGEGEWHIWSCKGRAGLVVVRAEADLREIVSVGRSVEAAREEPAAKTWFGPFNIAGDTIEWRSIKGAKAPFAIIQRWTLSDSENPDNEGAPKPYGLMVITRLPPGPVCHVALVDANENADHNVLARRVADEHARVFRCDSDKMLVVGKRGRAIELIGP